MRMLGLALEGGGARGAFHMGAVKALLEAGYRFDGVAGTSIGALNAAIIAQGDFTAGYQAWERMNNTLLLGIDEEQLEKIRQGKIDRETLRLITAKGRELIENRGIDTHRMRQVIEGMVDEEKLRRSPVDFGLVTVSLPDFKPVELFKEDIPPGKITEYIMASANFPGFRLEPIDGKFYLDGGLYDNIPINLLAAKGYREIIAIRTMSPGIIQEVKYPQLQLTTIRPSQDLGRMLDFDHRLILRNMEMGYYDALRVLRHLAGIRYYLQPLAEAELICRLSQLPGEAILRLGKILEVREMQPQRMLFEKVLPKAAQLLSLKPAATYQDIVVALLERLAEKGGLETFRIYSLPEFLAELQKIPAEQAEPLLPPRFSRRLLLLQAARELAGALFI